MALKITSVSGGGVGELAKTVGRHIFTAIDGETFAIGRVLGTFLLIVGLIGPTVVAMHQMLLAKPMVPLKDWIEFIQAMAIYIPALAGSVIGLVTLTNPTEPKAPAARSDP